MLQLAPGVAVPMDELHWSSIRAQGAGGQNVNKVSSALHLRFPIAASSLPQAVKQRLLGSGDRRISGDGVLVIKAQRYRTREQNRADAIERLTEIVTAASRTRKARKPTRPTRAARQRRLEGKAHRGRVKQLRRPVED